jgi:hypothetical protein
MGTETAGFSEKEKMFLCTQLLYILLYHMIIYICIYRNMALHRIKWLQYIRSDKFWLYINIYIYNNYTRNPLVNCHVSQCLIVIGVGHAPFQTNAYGNSCLCIDWCFFQDFGQSVVFELVSLDLVVRNDMMQGRIGFYILCGTKWGWIPDINPAAWE